MGNLTIEILLVFIQYFIMLFFCKYVLDLIFSKKQFLFIILIIFLPTGILFQFIGPISTLYYVLILAIMVYRETKFIMSILHVFMALIFLVISDNISYIIAFRLLNEIGNEQLIIICYFLFIIVFAIIFAFCYKRVVKYLSKRWGSKSISYILAFLSIITVIFIYINIMAIDQDNFYESVQNNLSMFLIYFVLLSISIFVVLYLAFKQYKMKQREQEMKNFESYVASIEQINQDMRKFKHDYINILSTLRTFIDDKNYEGLYTYFYDHILEANQDEQQLNQQAMMMLNNLKINSLKGLVTTKILQAQSHHVPFYIEIVEEITDIDVDPILLNRMVGILLDNAIEAARGVENGEVRMAFIRMDEVVLLVVSNIFDKKIALKVHEIYQEGFSTKGENRGLGLANLRQMTNDLHNVNLNTKISSPYFIQEIEFQKE
ncbi:sensor histidine kinase [Lysinibacillus sp. NPDC097214]|uniref:sensor histidine kinase n=1 Tax=Lysinibacillus sp. NPDC097214 TaxID=3390584 RepID=UPI003CFDD0AE